MRRLVKHIELTAPPPFVPSMLHPTIAGNVSRLSAECPLCLEVLNSPIVMSCTHSDRSKLLQEISAESCVISVSTADALAMRTELNIPWHKFRALKRSLPFVVLDVFIITMYHLRWLKMWQIEVASEKKMRLKADDLLGDNFKAEMVPLSFKHQNSGNIIKPAPLAYIPHLWDRVENILEQSDAGR